MYSVRGHAYINATKIKGKKSILFLSKAFPAREVEKKILHYI